MQSLRDKLLKAGAVSKKEARKSRQEQRQKKQKGRAGREQAQQQERAKAEQFAAKQEQQAKKAREHQAKVREQEENRAQQARLRDLVDRHTQWKTGKPERAFYIVMPDGKIRRLHLSFAVAEELTKGTLGVAHAPEDPQTDARIVKAEAIMRLLELAPERVLFYNHPTNESDLPNYGAKASAEAPPASLEE